MPPFYFRDSGSSLLSLLWILFQVDCLFPLHLFGLVSFYLAPSSVTYFFAVSFFIYFFMSEIVFLSYWLFGLRLPTLGFVGYWVELGLGAEMRNSVRLHSDEYSLGSEVLC